MISEGVAESEAGSRNFLSDRVAACFGLLLR